jgi:hypothetical protein
VRKSTAIVASLVAASSLVISIRLGELSMVGAIDAPASVGTNSPTTPDPAATNPTSPTQPGTVAPVDPAVTQPPVQVTMDSDVIPYKYGNVQISITKTDGLISAVSMLQGDATNGRAEAYLILTDATIQAQGTNYGNVSGATFTTDAFKIAVENALAKF